MIEKGGQDKPTPIGSMYGIFAYIWLKCMVTVGKYTSPMDCMGHIDSVVVFGETRCRFQKEKKEKKEKDKDGPQLRFLLSSCCFLNGI